LKAYYYKTRHLKPLFHKTKTTSKMKYTISTLLFLALPTITLSQDVKRCGGQTQELTYDLCRERTDEFKASTCDPMTNTTMQAKCVCFYQRELLTCFPHCLDPGPIAEEAALKVSATASCAAAGYPNFPVLESPAPWVKPEFQNLLPPVVPADPTTTTKGTTQPTGTETDGSTSTPTDSGVGKIAAGILLVVACALLL
jgi:hypothetical protein